ncbi:hypothetical protein O3P69_006897 [Scylla paramamosain]|uniref:C2H2-type domain-containing protein n=1 Tax=Scylla paramamosain TaxID=85552 RepID=A0AAW0U4M4_SCYPA
MSTMKGVESKQLVECMICGVLVGSVFSYHKHNVRQHSLAQLSRAILKLRNLKLPLVDPGEENATDEGDDDEDEDVMSGGINDPMDVLKLPVKVEVMDEVIELGPTDNSDHLQVQSRLLNSSDEASQHSSHVIEVKENHPPPCLFNPVVEDPNAITVKFNKELVTARDNSSSSVLFPEARKKGKEGNTKVLRATFKSTIEIPNPNSFIMDYKKAMSHSSEKYVMQNIDRLAPVVKKKRGRPRKNPENSRSNDTRVPAKGEAIRNEANDEEDGAFVGDPPLFSDEEDEEDNSVAVPSITKTRSGRKVFSVKEDCEKHMCEHISRVTSVNSENTHDNEHQGNSDEEMTEIITLSSKDLEASELEESPDKTSVSSLTAGDSGIKNEESLNRKHGGSAVTCDHCNKVFKNIMCLREHMTKVRKKEDPSRNICKFCRELVPPELWKEHMAKHKMKCSECGASEFRNHDEFMAHLEACRRCSSCGAVDFATREEYLAHVEMCGSSIDIMTGTLDAASDQEVVTSIFAIVDDSTCCGTCGEDFEDQLSLANHITEVHPDALPIDHTLEEAGSGGDTLYACPHEACGIIFMSKELLSDHLSSDHHT